MLLSQFLIRSRRFVKDEIEFRASYGKGGQLIRGGMDLRFAPGAGIGCTLTVKAAGSTTLIGQFFCNFGATYSQRFEEQSNALVARIDLS